MLSLLSSKQELWLEALHKKKGVDFNEIFSPVVKHNSIRALLDMVAFHDIELEQLDVKTTSLYSNLEEQIVMAQPEGFECKGMEDHMCLSYKSLYGIKQSSRQ